MSNIAEIAEQIKFLGIFSPCPLSQDGLTHVTFYQGRPYEFWYVVRRDNDTTVVSKPFKTLRAAKKNFVAWLTKYSNKKPRGGKRAGAGAPEENTNALKDPKKRMNTVKQQVTYSQEDWPTVQAALDTLNEPHTKFGRTAILKAAREILR